MENFRLLEQVLRSQRQWMNTFDSIHDIILAHDADYRIIKANQVLLGQIVAGCRGCRSGIAAKSVCRIPSASGLDARTAPWAETRNSQRAPTRASADFPWYRLRRTREQGSPQKGTIHVVRDITERRSAEEKYRLLFEQVQEGVYVSSPAGTLIDCNDAFVHMLGYSNRSELLVLNLESEICVDPKQREAFRKELETHNLVRNFDVTLRRKDGTLLLASESSFATRSGTGVIERYQGFVLDMTEKRRAEDEMQRRNRELNALNAMAVVAAQSFDLDEILNLTLRQVVTLFGAESGTVYLSDADNPTFRRRAAWGPRSRDKVRVAEISFPDGFGDLVMRSRAEVVTAEYMPHLPRKRGGVPESDNDRSWIWVLFWAKENPVGLMGLCSHQGYEYSSNDENLLVAISRQLATTIEKVRLYEETCRAYEDLRKTQEQLLQSEKMSAVGQLIAGVAHELNNPLTAILGYAQLLETEGLNTAGSGLRGQALQAGAAHAPGSAEPAVVSRGSASRSGTRWIFARCSRRRWPARLRSEGQQHRSRAGRSGRARDCRRRPHQIEQVFLNIINNAVDAILETGRTGEIEDSRWHAEWARVHILQRRRGRTSKIPSASSIPSIPLRAWAKGQGWGSASAMAS